MAITITPRLIIAAAERRGWISRIIDEKYSVYKLELPDGRYFYLKEITSLMSSTVNTYIVDRKELLSAIANSIGISVPDSIKYDGDTGAADAFLRKHGTVVVKPTSLSHGIGITVGIRTHEKLQAALQYAGQYGKNVIIQQHVEGDDYRLLFMKGEMVAAAIREPASVLGDGVSTVKQLIEDDNESDRREAGYNTKLTLIDAESAFRYLGESGLAAVPPTGLRVRVVGAANIGQGGRSIDVTDTVHHQIVNAAKNLVDHLNITVCGVDFIVDPASGTSYLIEANASPSLGLHEHPHIGKARNTPDRFLDILTA